MQAKYIYIYMDSAYPQTASCGSYINVHVNAVQSFVIDIAIQLHVPHDSPICMQSLEKILIGSLCINTYSYVFCWRGNSLVYTCGEAEWRHCLYGPSLHYVCIGIYGR